MDINLPGESGLKLTRKINKTHPEISIIILTSHDAPAFRRVAYEAGASGFLVKGCLTLEELMTAVKSLFSLGVECDFSRDR